MCIIKSIQTSGTEGRFDESVTYNANGSILSLLRSGMKNDGTFGTIDDLTITYDGNQLVKVSDDAEALNYNGALDFHDGADTDVEYTYDNNGALTKDGNRGIKGITYDYGHHPYYINMNMTSGPRNIRNDYTPDGRKLSSKHVMSFRMVNGFIRKTTTDLYIDGLILRGDTTLLWQFDGGYVDLDANGTPTCWNYYVTDHLGSTRMVVDSNDSIREVINYYPFGSEMQMTNPAQIANSLGHPFRFTGKELDKLNGLNMYDFGARLFDVAGVPMWTSVDPLAEKYYNVSPYVYCANDPIRYIDPTGMDYWSTSDPKEIDTFLKTVQSTGLADANMEKWDHTSDANFIADLSYNDKTQKFWYSSCNIENGEVVCTGKSFSPHTPATLTVINSLGISLKENAGNSTLGNNGNFYWHASNEKGFYGNQYVETVKLAKFGSAISKVTGPIGWGLSGYNIYKGYQLDGGIGYNTIRATADAAGGWLGASAGAAAGAKAGFTISMWSGWGSIPCTIIGGAIGGVAGSLGFSWGGTSIVDTVYGR